MLPLRSLCCVNCHRLLFAELAQCHKRPARLAVVWVDDLWRPPLDPRPLAQLTGREAADAVSYNLRRRSGLKEALAIALWLDVLRGELLALVADPSLEEVARGANPPGLELELTC